MNRNLAEAVAYAAEAELEAAFEAHGQQFDAHTYWNSDYDYYIDVCHWLRPTDGSVLAANVQAIQARYLSGSVRVHICWCW